jgi:hypothetical protein
MTDTPTPPDADARAIIAERIYAMFGDQQSEVERETARWDADQIIAALHAAGLTITRPARGMVTISAEAVKVMLTGAEWAEKRIPIRENPLALAIINFRAAIAATDPQEPTS